MEIDPTDVRRYLLGHPLTDMVRAAIEETIDDPNSQVRVLGHQLARISRLMTNDEMPFDPLPQRTGVDELTFDSQNLKQSFREMALRARELQRSGDNDSALAVRRKLLNLAIVHLGEDDRDTLTYANAVAKSYYELRDFDQAAVLFEKVVDCRTRIMGANHSDTAFSLTGLARSLEMLSEYREATELNEKALEIIEATFGSDHPETGTALNDLGCSLTTIGNYQKAAICFQRSLAISIEFDGPDNRNTATVLGNLAGAQRQVGDLQSAQQSLVRALDIFKGIGGSPSDFAWVESQLLSVLYEQEEDEKARELGESALDRPESNEIEPFTRGGLFNMLGVIFMNSGRRVESQQMFKNAAGEFETALSGEHICKTIVRWNSLAAIGEKANWQEYFEPAAIPAGLPGKRSVSVQIAIEGKLVPMEIGLAS